MLTALRQAVLSSWISLLLVGGILAGAIIGRQWPPAGALLAEGVDPTLLALVGLLFFGIRFEAITLARGGLRAIGLILAVNFALVPAIGYAIASALLSTQPLFMVGLMIYFMSPCTDWFLGFTRLARGNVALGTALIPINMAVQLLLYPVYLHLFTRSPVEVEAGSVVIFNGYLLHRSLPNHAPAGTYRRALVNHYMSCESRLPWGKTPEGDHNAHYDYRDIIVVAGRDPYAYRGYADIQKPSVRPSGQGGCDKWGGGNRKYRDEAKAPA